MTSIDRYIFRTTFGAFALIVISLTAFIWITQALREIDLMTNQGQTILVFIGMTGLLIPVLVLIIAPIALMIAVTYALNKFNADSEFIIMSAAGMSSWRVFAPFFAVALVVSLLVGAIGAYVAPKGLRELRNWAAKVRADLVTTIIQPGRFTTIERGLTFHVRERRPNGQLMGIFIDDRRDPTQHATFLAERGEIVENEGATYLMLIKGDVQRQEGAKDPTMVKYERYAFDLSRFNNAAEGRTLTPRERYLWDIAWPDPNDPLFKVQPGMFRAELHDRLAAPLYPITFAVIAFAFLGKPSTTRQSRAMLLAMTITAVMVLRFIGFGSAIFAAQKPMAVVILYASVAIALVLGTIAISRGRGIEPPAFLTNAIAAISTRFARTARVTSTP
jgi:lipopolysaccharide export system permease protein